MGRKPFKISNKNEELFFLRDCQGQARTSSFVWLAGKYKPDNILKPLPGNCTVSSLMPVLGYQREVAADYDRLMKGGFIS